MIDLAIIWEGHILWDSDTGGDSLGARRDGLDADQSD